MNTYSGFLKNWVFEKFHFKNSGFSKKFHSLKLFFKSCMHIRLKIKIYCKQTIKKLLSLLKIFFSLCKKIYKIGKNYNFFTSKILFFPYINQKANRFLLLLLLSMIK